MLEHLPERSISSDVVSQGKYTSGRQFVARIGHRHRKCPSLGAMIFAAWRLARLLAVKLVEEELTERAQRPTEWPNCEKCGKKLESKGFDDRQLTELIGTVRWERREGRCPDRCEIGQVAPLDRELGLWPNQRTSAGLKRAACALAVFVPFEIAAVLLSLLTEVVISPGSIWNWVQAAGQAAMTRLERQLEALKRVVRCPRWRR